MPVLFRLKKFLSRLCLTFTLPWLVLLLSALFVPSHLTWIVPIWLLVIALAAIIGPVLLERLANRYPQLDPQTLPPDKHYLIAVAGSGFQHHPKRTPETWFTDELSTRMAEAGRVAQILNKRHIPYQIIVSIPEHPHQNPTKLRGLHAFFRNYQVPAPLLSVLDHVLDSEDEIEAFSQKGHPIIMVSSSWHVPRFITMGKTLGCTIYPAPAGYFYENNSPLTQFFRLPTAGGLSALECVLHEFAGATVFKLKTCLFPKH